MEDNAFMLRELRLVKLQLKNMQEKEKSKEFTQTWENNVTPDTHDPILRVRSMLEKPKQWDATMEYMLGRRRKQQEKLQRVHWGN